MKVVLAPSMNSTGKFSICSTSMLDAPPVALETRVMLLRTTLARHPRIGLPIEHRDLHECWIPGTRLVVWYRVTPAAIEIARFWHTSQDRSKF